MTFRHGRFTVVTLNGIDYSAFSDNTDWGDESDTHETTTYGRDRKTYSSGLGDGTVSVGGTDADDAGNAADLFEPIKAAGLPVEFVFRPHGTGAGKRQKIVDVIVKNFKTTAPVGGMVKWTAELQMTGPLDQTVQS